jgi:hypothetical protein
LETIVWSSAAVNCQESDPSTPGQTYQSRTQSPRPQAPFPVSVHAYRIEEVGELKAGGNSSPTAGQPYAPPDVLHCLLCPMENATTRECVIRVKKVQKSCIGIKMQSCWALEGMRFGVPVKELAVNIVGCLHYVTHKTYLSKSTTLGSLKSR